MSKQLTVERLRHLLTYDPETGLFHRRVDVIARHGVVIRKAGTPADLKLKSGYRRVIVDGIQCLSHRLAWFYMTGVWPDFEIDHRDKNRANNRWANLRDVTGSVNMQNSSGHRDSKSGLLGAHWDPEKKRWSSKIRVNGVNHYLGRFDTALAAHEAYMKAKAQHHVSAFA